MNHHSYVVITPARNEEKYIGFTIRSMLNQTIQPSLWIIVDDGSSDATANIVADAASGCDWIKLVRNNPSSGRGPGRNVVFAFNRGISEIDRQYDFLVKFDADLQFEPDYFEKLLQKFTEDPQLGIGGGYCAIRNGKELTIDQPPDYHVRGATKMYRRECFEQIGGLVPAMGWDGLDEMKAMMLGWRTKSFRDLVLVHCRATGSETGLIHYAWMWGKSAYFMGYDPLFFLASCIAKFKKKPYGIFGCTMVAGYLKSFLSRAEVLADEELVRFIRQFQRNRLRLKTFFQPVG